MGTTNAYRQSRFRNRQAEAERVRLNTYISADAHRALVRAAEALGRSKKAALEHLIQVGVKDEDSNED